jgi:hypothetical protein
MKARALRTSHHHLTPAANSSSRNFRCAALAMPTRDFYSTKMILPFQMNIQSGHPARTPRARASSPEIALRGAFSNAVEKQPAGR